MLPFSYPWFEGPEHRHLRGAIILPAVPSEAHFRRVPCSQSHSLAGDSEHSGALAALSLIPRPPPAHPMESFLRQPSTVQALSHWQITMMDGGGLGRMLWIWPGLLCWLPLGF